MIDHEVRRRRIERAVLEREVRQRAVDRDEPVQPSGDGAHRGIRLRCQNSPPERSRGCSHRARPTTDIDQTAGRSAHDVQQRGYGSGALGGV